mgnify:FL=1
MKRSTQVFAVSALAAALAACGGDGLNSSSDATGTASFNLTDAAVDSVQEVNISIVALELKRDDEIIRFDVDPASGLENINLLDLQDGTVATLISEQELPAGQYEWVRLKLGDESTFSVVDDNGGVHGLFVPSGDTRGLQTSGFVVPADGIVSFTIDFDVRKSLINPPGLGRYLLKPVLRLADNSQVGTITGAIDPTLLTQTCSDSGSNPSTYAGAVYIHEGHDVIPDDLGSSNEPLVVTPVDTETYEYGAWFIPEGNYTVSYTCDIDELEDTDGSPADEDLTFVPAEGIEIVVQAGEETSVTFE